MARQVTVGIEGLGDDAAMVGTSPRSTFWYVNYTWKCFLMIAM